jgi:hypothetical protein
VRSPLLAASVQTAVIWNAAPYRDDWNCSYLWNVDKLLSNYSVQRTRRHLPSWTFPVRKNNAMKIYRETEASSTHLTLRPFCFSQKSLRYPLDGSLGEQDLSTYVRKLYEISEARTIQCTEFKNNPTACWKTRSWPVFIYNPNILLEWLMKNKRSLRQKTVCYWPEFELRSYVRHPLLN